MTNYPTNEDFLVEVESALEKQLLPEPGFAALERTRDAVMGAVYPLVAELRNQPRAVEPAGELREPDNPAAHALAKYIADHPISTVQAAFRYLNTPFEITLCDQPAAPLSDAASHAHLRNRADAVAAELDHRLTQLRAIINDPARRDREGEHARGEVIGLRNALGILLNPTDQ